MSNTTVPTKDFTFVSGGTIRSSEINANFDEIYTELAAIGTANLLANAITTAKVADEQITLAKLSAAVQAALAPSGSVIATARSSAPTGWLLCDGSAVSRTTYADLFSAISTTYGVGDGATTFNVPNVKGRVIAGKESSETLITTAVSGFTGATLGATGGAQSHTLVSGEMPSHTHTDSGHTHGVTDPTHTHGYNAPNGTTLQIPTGGANSAVTTQVSTSTNAASTGITINSGTASLGSTGGGGAHRNVQPTIILNYIIKT
jgi:microcystin-dependent protein